MGSRATPIGTMGAGGRYETICERKRAETLLLGSQEGQWRGVSPIPRGGRLSAVLACSGSNEKGNKDEKRRALRGTMGSRTGRKEGRDKLAWLDRGNCAGPAVTGLGVSLSEI